MLAESWSTASTLAPAVYVLAVLAVITVVQRIWHVRRELVAPP